MNDENPAPEPTNTSNTEPISEPIPDQPTQPAATHDAAPVLPTSGKAKKKMTALLVAIAAAVVIFSGVAAAYFGVVVPNKPENLLKTAIKNTLEQKEISFEGRITSSSTDNIPASTISLKGHSDSQKHTAQAELGITVSGVSLPLEIRYVEKNLYFKFGDLNNVRIFESLTDPSYQGVIEQAIVRLSNRWVEVDNTLLRQAKADCALESGPLTTQDIDSILDTYKNTRFATIKNTTKDTVEGSPATKYEIEIDDNKGSDYFSKLNNLPTIKKMRDCAGTQTNNIIPPADNDKTPLTLWVDRGTKRIIKIAGHTSEQDKKKYGVEGNMEINLKYDSVNVTKPDGAIPATQLIYEFISGADSPVLDGRLPFLQI